MVLSNMELPDKNLPDTFLVAQDVSSAQRRLGFKTPVSVLTNQRSSGASLIR
jgi:hypothetical protein